MAAEGGGRCVCNVDPPAVAPADHIVRLMLAVAVMRQGKAAPVQVLIALPIRVHGALELRQRADLFVEAELLYGVEALG